MNTCSFTSGNGINSGCEAFFAATKGLIFTKPNFTIATKAAAKSLETWRVGLQQKDSDGVIPVFATLPLMSMEHTMIDASIETDGFGRDHVNGLNPPKMIAYLSSNPCDYKGWVSMGKQNVRIFLEDESGSRMGTITTAGVFKGFYAEMIAIPLSGQGRDNQTQQYKVIINFKEVDEFKNYAIVNASFTLSELNALQPASYTMEISTAYSAPTLVVKLYKNCDETVLATDTFVAVIVDKYTNAPASAGVVTVGAISAGLSSLSIYSTGTTQLAAGEEITFYLNKVSGSVIQQMTNTLTVRGV